MKILPMLGSMVFSYAGWYLAEPLGFGWAFLISGVAAMIGVYAGWKAARRLGL